MRTVELMLSFAMVDADDVKVLDGLVKWFKTWVTLLLALVNMI